MNNFGKCIEFTMNDTDGNHARPIANNMNSDCFVYLFFNIFVVYSLAFFS